MRVLFSSDLHGNKDQYQSLVTRAVAESVDVLILGGDNAPGYHRATLPDHGAFVREQQRWYTNELYHYLHDFKEDLPDSQIIIIPGNHDAKEAITKLHHICHPLATGAEYAHERRIELSDTLDVVGYSYVPFTRYPLKDWEKWDTGQNGIARGKLVGVRSSKDGWKNVDFSDKKNDNIQKDLSRELFTQKPGSTIYVMHAPPNDTALDCAREEEKPIHVGSKAIKDFIKYHQPLITLHGHAHRTVDYSGAFRERIGDTFSYAVGNDPNGFKAHAILLDTDSPGDGERILC